MRWPLVLLSACLFMAGQTPAAAIESVPTIAQARALYEDGLNQQAVAAAQAVLLSAPDATSQREAYRILGRAYTKMALYDAALQALSQAEQLAQQASSAREAGLSLVYQGDVYERRKDHPQAMAHYTRALAILEPAKAWPEARRAWLQIGDIEVAHADYDAGQKAYRQALAFAQKSNDPAAIAEALDYLGYAYRRLGDHEKASQAHRQAAKKAAAIRDNAQRQKALARAYNHLGLALRGSASQARTQGEPARAGQLLQAANSAEKAALKSAQASQDRVRQGYILRAASLIEREQAELQATQSIKNRSRFLQASLASAEQALQLAQAMRNPEWEGLALHSIGLAQARLGQLPAAEASFSRAIALWQNIGDQNALGYAHSLYASELLEPHQRLEAADAQYRAAASAFSSIKALDELAGVYYKQGGLAERLGQREQARDFYLLSIDTLEAIRSQLSAEDSRLTFFGGRQAPYEALLRLQSRAWQQSQKTSDAELAFEISERARGRTLLEIMSRASLFRYAGLDPELLAQEQALELALNNANQALRRAHASSENAALLVQREAAANALARFNQTLKQSHPAYTYLRNPQPLSTHEVRTQALQPGQVLLEYFIGTQESYVFALSRDGDLQLHTLAITRADLLNKIKQLRAPFETVKTSGSLDGLARFDTRLAHELYATLFKPVEPAIQGARELLVVPHGPLFYFPLEMLVAETRTAQRRTPRYLIERTPPLRYALSASLLNPILNPADQTANARVLAFMDPAITNVFGTANSSLPAAKREMLGLRQVYGARMTVYSDQGATKKAFLSSSPGYGTVILSAHGTFDEASPQESGILLAGSLERQNWLNVQDVFGLRLQADLVSLGVCEVGLGKIQDGEGLLGFTRAWQYAGAKRLLVTLWSVEDNATADLSIDFHRREAGETHATALRRAKLALLNSRFQQNGSSYKRANPFFWAPYVLY